MSFANPTACRAASLPALVLILVVLAPASANADKVLPSIAPNLVVHYDFDHPVAGDETRETDLGASGTPLWLVNGGGAMRVEDAAYPSAGRALQTRQVDPTVNGNDDWKAGVYRASGAPALAAFNAVRGITIMGWIKPTGPNPGPDSTTPDRRDRFGAVGLFGLLSGTSDGHLVRALIEIITVADSQRLVALGRRLDGGNRLLLVAREDWEDLLPTDRWTHLAASFDYDEGTMALYRNGERVPADYSGSHDGWQLSGEAKPRVTSATHPAGIKVGGSFPQNTVERNPFNGRFDDLMFFNRALTGDEVRAQFAFFTGDP